MIVLYMYLCTVEFYCNVNDRLFRLYSPDGGAAPVNGRATNYTIGADTDENLGAKSPEIFRVPIFVCTAGPQHHNDKVNDETENNMMVKQDAGN